MSPGWSKNQRATRGLLCCEHVRAKASGSTDKEPEISTRTVEQAQSHSQETKPETNQLAVWGEGSMRWSETVQMGSQCTLLPPRTAGRSPLGRV